MKRTKYLLPLILAAVLCFTALAESSLLPLVDAAERLAFHTDNVTITGKADFLLDGERFKTAEITYVQDGENSLWREKLLTPLEWRSDYESGFTVVQNGNAVYVTETLHPGMYRTGADDAQSTLMRRHPMADLLLTMARGAVTQLEPFFGNAVTEQQMEDGGREVCLEIAEADAPDLLSYIANLGLRLIGDRLFGTGGYSVFYPVYKEGLMGFPWTETMLILCRTKSLSLGDTSIRVRTDASGRLAAVSGDLTVRLTGYSEEDGVREQFENWWWYGRREHTLTVRFDTALSGYGESRVEAFDPTGLRKTSYAEMWHSEIVWKEDTEALTDAQKDSLAQRGRDLCRAAGIHVYALTSLDRLDGRVYLRFDASDGPVALTMMEDGALLTLDAGRFEASEDAAEVCPDEIRQPIMDFLRTANPKLETDDLMILGLHSDDSSRFICVVGIGEDGLFTDTLLSVRLDPSWQILQYTCLGNG